MVIQQGNECCFRFYRPDASEAYLAGDFNNWAGRQLRMTRGADGYWEACLHLPRGEHRFRYFADGQWYADYAAFGVEPGLGGLDSVLRVRPEGQPEDQEGSDTSW